MKRYIFLIIALFTSLICLSKEKLAHKSVSKDKIQTMNNLEISVWATSPMLFNPTNMDTDEKGRIWVTEGVNYRKHKNRRPDGDRIIVLEDSNGDGKADKSHVFLQDKELVSPLGIAVFDNKIVVSQPPNLLVYTDVDRNLKFDPKIDKKEILISGFNGRNHDHSLHATISGPDGYWYLNQGNCGAKMKDKDGKEFLIGGTYYKSGGGDWFYDTRKMAGKKSPDGFIYHGGFIGRFDPQGKNMAIMGSGFRNSYEHCINSMGEIFQSDNDDTLSCRNSFVLRYGDAGYFAKDGKRKWRAEQRPGQDIPTAHWHQEDPGFMPVGDVYGRGSPAGGAFYENGALPKKFIGMYMNAEAGRREIIGYLPTSTGAGYKLERFSFLKVKNEQEPSSRFFRPSDVMVGADGAIYICDWYDSGVGGHADRDTSLSGTIYRVAPKGFKSQIINYDSTTVEGCIGLLKSPANNVRFKGFVGLKLLGKKALPKVLELISDPNKWLACRGVWLLPYLGEEGLKACEKLLESEKKHFRLTAYKALLSSGKQPLSYAKKLINDKEQLVLRELSTSLRNGKSYANCKELLISLAKKIDYRDRTALEAFGIGATNKEDLLWKDLSLIESLRGTDRFNWLTWRLMSYESIGYLKKRILSNKLSEKDRLFALDSLAFIHHKQVPLAILDFWKVKLPPKLKERIQMWSFMKSGGGSWDELIARKEFEQADILKPLANIQPMTVPVITKRKIPKVSEILKLTGSLSSGKIVSARCLMCHQLENKGISYGPSLDGWAKQRTDEVILAAILNPSAEIAHGYMGKKIYLEKGGKVDGLLLGEDSRYMTVQSAGGVIQKIPKKQIKWVSTLKKQSLMYRPESLGLTKAQDFADLLSYLKSLKNIKAKAK